jgi:hypothetical protein
LQYKHENPVRAGIVFEGIDYIYRSATNYANQKSVFNIDFFMVITLRLRNATEYSFEARTLRRTGEKFLARFLLSEVAIYT